METRGCFINVLAVLSNRFLFTQRSLCRDRGRPTRDIEPQSTPFMTKSCRMGLDVELVSHALILTMQYCHSPGLPRYKFGNCAKLNGSRPGLHRTICKRPRTTLHHVVRSGSIWGVPSGLRSVLHLESKKRYPFPRSRLHQKTEVRVSQQHQFRGICTLDKQE